MSTIMAYYPIITGMMTVLVGSIGRDVAGSDLNFSVRF